jgi:hypothetical protein
MTVKDITAKAAAQLNLPTQLVWEVYKLYWSFIRHHMSSLSLKDVNTEEDLSKLRPNINIPSLGKFYVDWDKLKRKRENERYKNKKD